MIRLLQIVLLIVIGVLVWRALRQWLVPPPAAGGTPRFEPTGRCAKCGTHVPSQELDNQARCPRCRTDTA